MSLPSAEYRPAILVWAFVMVFLLMKAGDVWAGGFPDNDDMMRLLQVRDLMAGQSWFDVGQARFDTPEGGIMHWSRIPDLFMAGIIFVTRPLIGQVNAENLAMLLWPLMLLSAAMAGLVLVLKRLGAGAAGMASALVLFTVSAAIYQWWPGRIDHHGLEATLVIIGLAAVLSPKRSLQSAVIVALCIALMISTAIESLPYAGALVLSMGLLWIVRGGEEGRRMAVFGMATAVCAALAFIVDAPGVDGLRAVCDAYGEGHLAGLVVGGGLLAFIGSRGHMLRSWQIRLIIGGVAGAITVAAALYVSPQCLASPYAGVDADVQAGWLNVVGEARSIGTVMTDDLAKVIADFGFIFAGLLAAIYAVWTTRGDARINWVIISLLLCLGAAATVWQVRSVLFAHVFAAIAAGWALGLLIERYLKVRGVPAVLMLTAGAVLLAPLTWKALGSAIAPYEPLLRDPVRADGEPYAVTCRLPEAFAPAAGLPAGRIATPIDLGTSFLVRTPHTIFSAPYHRNVGGIGFAIRLFHAQPDVAYDMLVAKDADYFAYCAGLSETNRYARTKPDGLAAMLISGTIPDWLEPADGLTETDGVVRVYRVKR